jgi:hypothetical protein
VMNAAHSRSNKTKGSGGYYGEFTTFDALRLTPINHAPAPSSLPSTSPWPIFRNTPVLLFYAQKLRENVRFFADGRQCGRSRSEAHVVSFTPQVPSRSSRVQNHCPWQREKGQRRLNRQLLPQS